MKLLLITIGLSSLLSCNALNYLRSVSNETDSGRGLQSNPTFLPDNGLLVIEAESAVTITPPWKLECNMTNYTGTGFLRFDGNSPEGGSPLGELKYFFRIDDPGQYKLVLRMRNNNMLDTHLSNDCYICVPGQKSYLGEITKAYLAGRFAKGTWKWATNLEVDHDAGFFPEPIYTFDTPGTYELQLFGRSQHLLIDRMILYRMDSVSFVFAEGLARPESQRETIVAPTTAPVHALVPVKPASTKPVPAPVLAPYSVPVPVPFRAPVSLPAHAPVPAPVPAPPVSIPALVPALVPALRPVFAPISRPVFAPDIRPVHAPALVPVCAAVPSVGSLATTPVCAPVRTSVCRKRQFLGECKTTKFCKSKYPTAFDCKNSEGGVCYCRGNVVCGCL